MNPPRMVAADTPDRGHIWYLVDVNLDFIPEVKLFLDWEAATRHAPATIKAYCSRLLWFYRFLAQHQLPVEEVTAAHLTEFVIWLQHPGRAYPHKDPVTGFHPLSASSINLIVQEVADLYRFLVRRGFIAQSPVVYVAAPRGKWASERDLLAHTRPRSQQSRLEMRMKEPTRRPATISEQEFQIFLNSISTARSPQADPGGFRDRLICLMLKEGGVRLGELLGMRLSDLDFGQGGVHVRFRADNENAARAKAGYGRDRFVHLPPSLLGLLDLYLTEVWIDVSPRTDHLWIVLNNHARNREGQDTCGTALSAAAVESMFQHYSKRSGIRLHPHQLRHSHATELVRSYLRAGQPVDWKFIQERLGHAVLSPLWKRMCIWKARTTSLPTRPLSKGGVLPMPRLKRKRRSEPHWTLVQRKLLAVLEQQENRKLGPGPICQLAGYGDWAWDRATKDPRFVARLKQLGVSVGQPSRGRPQKHLGHLEVCLAADPEEELAKECWDMRRLLPDYPRHRQAAAFFVDFTCIIDPDLRAQVKLYFRHRLTRWKAGTFKCMLGALMHPLRWLPAGVHLGTMKRSHMEDMLLLLAQDSQDARYRGLLALRVMLEYAATSPAWPGPRPPHDLIWAEDLPSAPITRPRPLPPDVLEQLDALLDKAMDAMDAGREPGVLPPMYWDAVLILRRTGMRFEDLAHLKAPDANKRDGCLVQDSEGYWWIVIDHRFTKMGRDHRIPTRQSDGVIAAIQRQQERAQQFPDHFHEHYLFRQKRGVLTGEGFRRIIQQKLAPHLLHEGKPYRLTAHQFRHTIATEMIDQGIDIYTVKEFLGHQTLQMTERYVQIYLKSLKAKYDAYRAKQHRTSATPHMMAAPVEIAPPKDAPDGGWVEGRVGTLYRSPLPDGIGWCEHLAMLDPCPTPPHCPTCPKLRASKQHLPIWESKARNLLITVESLRDNPVYERARLRHEQELQHAEKVITTIKGEGFWDGRIHNG